MARIYPPPHFLEDRIEIYHGDALRLMRAMPGDSFDAIITDPPYCMGATLAEKGRSTADKYLETRGSGAMLPNLDGDSLSQRAWTEMMTTMLDEARRLCKPGAVCVLFSDWRQLPSLSDAVQIAGWIWRGVLVWDKKTARPQKGRFRQQAEFMAWGSHGPLPVDRPVPVLPGVFGYTNVRPAERMHQTQKPLELMRDLVKICMPGGAILDPFAGAGTTLLAAAQEGFKAVGIERSAAIARTAAERLGVPLWEGIR